MFQFGFSIANEHEKWFETIEEVFAIRVKKAGGIYAAVKKNDRTVIAAACETRNKNGLISEIRDCLIDMYATVVKHDFLTSSIKLPMDAPSYNLLIHTLVAFDRENERDLIKDGLIMRNGMSLDGIYYFRLRELRKHWEEISELAVSNAPFLLDEDTLNELIRFLISAVNPKIMRLDVTQKDNKYNVSGHLPESDFEYNIVGTEQLMLYLIDIAPLELRLYGHFTDKRLCDRLVRIFDAKREDNCEVSGRC